MKRGLKLIDGDTIKANVQRLNPGPDEEGIETISATMPTSMMTSPNPGPDEEGIETFATQAKNSILPNVRTQAPMKRGLKPKSQLNLERVLS